MGALVATSVLSLAWLSLVATGMVELRSLFACGLVIFIWLFSAFALSFGRIWFGFPHRLLISDRGLTLEFAHGRPRTLAWNDLRGRAFLQNLSADPRYGPTSRYCLEVLGRSPYSMFLFLWTGTVYLTGGAFLALKDEIPAHGLSLSPLEESLHPTPPFLEIYKILD
jgi:hypothetical protein